MHVKSLQNPATNCRGRSFHIEGPTTAKARCWVNEVRDRGTKRSSRPAERRGREERAESGLQIKSHSRLGVGPCWDLVTRGRALYFIRAEMGANEAHWSC